MISACSRVVKFVLWVSVAGRAGAQALVDVGVAPPGTRSTAEGVSADGTVVAVWGSKAGRTGSASYRWTVDEGLELISPASESWSPVAVSDDGSTLIGISFVNGIRTFRWNRTEGFEQLETLPDSVWTEPHDVNADGEVVVGANYRYTDWKAFRWTRDGGMEEIGTLPGMSYSTASGVSADGSVVVGGSRPSSSDSRESRAFRWTAGLGMEELPMPPGATRAFAASVSADGLTIVGNEGATGAYPDGLWERPCRWSEAGVEVLPFPAGLERGAAFAVSEDGSVVAGVCGTWTTYDEDFNAVVWSPRLGAVNLNEYLPSVGVDMTGWHLVDARDVSADGRVIVGWGVYYGEDRGYVVTLGACGTSDFDGDGDFGTDGDIEGFFACLGGACCESCFGGGADFDGDGDVGTDGDIEAFFRVLSGGAC